MKLNLAVAEDSSVICNSIPEIDKLSLELTYPGNKDTLNFILDYVTARKIVSEISQRLPENF